MRLSRLKNCVLLRRMLENPGDLRRLERPSSEDDTVALRFRDGRRLCLRAHARDYHIFQRVFLEDTYGVGGLQRRRGCVLDIGANVGVFACLIAPTAERIVCCEPASSNFAALELNLATLPCAKACRHAVAGQRGTVRLYLPDSPRHSGQASLHPEVDGYGWTAYEDVASKTLEDVFRDEEVSHCSLLKIDVEGAEYEILGSAGPEVLGATDAIVGEYHRIGTRAPGEDLGRLVAHLERAGFRVCVRSDRRRTGHGIFSALRDAQGI